MHLQLNQPSFCISLSHSYMLFSAWSPARGIFWGPSLITLNKLYFPKAFRNTLQPVKNDDSAPNPNPSQQSFLQQFLHHFPLQRLPVNLPVQPDSIRPRLSCFPLSTSTHCSSPRLLSAFMKALGILFEPTRIGNERAEHSWSAPSPSPTTITPLQCTLV